jgi:UrcA family protein
MAQDEVGKTVTVHHADLDLSSESGRAKLNRRIANATETLCGSYAGVMAEGARQIDACRASAGQQIATQIAQLRSPAQVATR